MKFNLQQPNALVVDDDPAIVKMISRFLEGKGYSCSVAESGRDALQLIDETHFDLVVSDMHMPDITGMGLLQEVVVRSPSTATVMLTGDAERRTEYQALAAGVDVFLNKAADPDEIETEIARALLNKTVRLAAAEVDDHS